MSRIIPLIVGAVLFFRGQLRVTGSFTVEQRSPIEMNFNLTGYELALIAGGFGIIRALLGNWVGHRFTESRDRRKEFNDAATEFRREFTEMVKTIRESHPGTRRFETTCFFQLFTSTYNTQYNALLHFKAHLNKKDQEKIEKAWEDHCWGDYIDEKESHGPFLHYHYESEVEMRDGEPHTIKTLEEAFNETKQLATENVERLLSFAKPK